MAAERINEITPNLEELRARTDEELLPETIEAAQAVLDAFASLSAIHLRLRRLAYGESATNADVRRKQIGSMLLVMASTSSHMLNELMLIGQDDVAEQIMVDQRARCRQEA